MGPPAFLLALVIGPGCGSGQGTTADSATGNTGIEDTSTTDTSTHDTATTDTSTTDTATTDTSTTDTSTVDTAIHDTADTEIPDSDSGEDTGSPLQYYAPAGDPQELADISSNLSGITWNTATGTFMAVRDSSRRVHEYSASLVHLREITLDNVSHTDLEDIVYLGSDSGDHEYAMVAEDGTMVIGVIPDDGGTTLDVSEFQLVTYAAEPSERNKGGEGVAYDPVTETFWVCVEKDPMTIYTFSRPPAGTNASYQADLVVSEAFDAETALGGTISDISSCMYDSRSSRLLVLSHESGVVLDVALDGTIVDSLAVELDLKGSDKPEGVTINDVQDLIVVGEPNEIRVYRYSGP